MNSTSSVMQIGYARVSTQDQNPALQTDALKKAGCRKIFVEKASGAKSDRVELQRLLDQVRQGDVIVVWKLDRLGRSLKHLVEIVGDLIEKGVGLKSLQDPIDTTTSQGRLIFNIFASLAEFERDLIRERTQAGLAAARARGRLGGRPKGLSAEAGRKAVAAAALYREGKLSANEIARNLALSKATLYSYLRHQGVEIGPYCKGGNKPAITKVELWLRVEGNNKYVRGMKRVRQEIEDRLLAVHHMTKSKKDGWEYVISVEHRTDEELDKIMYEVLREASDIAEARMCFIETEAHAVDDPERSW